MDRNRDDIKKTIDRKLRILYVMDYLRENSDEDHPVKLSDIQKAITDRGIYTTRKALYDDFEVLSDYGFEIIRVDGTYTYYYSNPLFEFAELKLMIDIDGTSVQINILNGESTEFRNSHSGMK